MKIPHFVAALGAAVLLPLTVGVPTAHADENFTGTVEPTDQAKVFTKPNVLADQCDPGGTATESPQPYDAVQFVSQSNGPRRIVLTTPTPGSGQFAIYAYRNGACVAADYTTPGDTPEVAELAAGVLDLDNVVFAVGDTVRIEILSFDLPAVWSLSILQPGTASSTAPAIGNGTKYVGLSYQIDCVTHTTPVSFTKKFAKKVDNVKWVKVKANGATVKKLKGKKLAKVAKKAKKGHPYVVTGVPAGTTQLSVEVKLESGKKKSLSRVYSAC